jgi:hypothetical protein
MYLKSPQRSWVRVRADLPPGSAALRIVPSGRLHVCIPPQRTRLNTMMLMNRGVGKMTGSKAAVPARSHVSSYACCHAIQRAMQPRCLHWQRMGWSVAQSAVLC